jgi:hypothetical protein
MGAGIRILAAFLAALAAATAGGVTAQLRQDYYAAVCPDLESIVRDAVSKKVQAQPVAVGATIRLFFHDCFVEVRGRPLSFLVPPSQSFDWRYRAGEPAGRRALGPIACALKYLPCECECDSDCDCDE